MRDVDQDLKRLAAELLGALHDEPLPPAIRDLALRLQNELDARAKSPLESD